MNNKQETVSVQYYAILREQRGCRSEEITTTASTAAELYDELKKKHGFSLSADSLRVAINDEFTEWETSLKSGDTVIFIPPVAGG